MKTLEQRIVSLLEEKKGKKFKQREISRMLHVKQKDYVNFKQILNSMSESGEISKHSKYRFGAKEKSNYAEGVV